MDRLWHQAGRDMHMSCYRVVPTGNETGFLEVVGHAETLASIVVQSVEAEHEAEPSSKAISTKGLSKGASFKRRAANLGHGGGPNALSSEKSSKKGHLTAAAMKLKAMRAVANKDIIKAWLEEGEVKFNLGLNRFWVIGFGLWGYLMGYPGGTPEVALRHQK